MEEKQLSDRLNLNWAIVVVVAIGLAARLYNLNYQSLWYDELHSMVASGPEKSIASIIEYCKVDQPPFSFLYLHFVFKIFAYEDWVGRLACTLVGVAAIPVMYLLGREFGNRDVGLFAALLSSINYFHIYHSQEVRFYSMSFLLSALSFLYFIRAAKDKRILNFALYVIFTSALLYTHYFGMFVFGSQCVIFLFLLFYQGWNRRFLLLGLLSGCLTAASFIPWLPTVFRDLEITSYWVGTPAITFILEYFYIYTGEDEVAVAILGLLVFLSIRHFRSTPAIFGNSAPPSGWVLLLWIGLCYLVPYIRSITSAPILLPRYTIVLLPAWLIVFGIGWSSLKSTRLKYVVLFVLCLSATINILLVKKHYRRVRKDQFREASEFVIRKNVEKWPVYAPLAWHYNFYFKDERIKVLPIDGIVYAPLDHFWMLQGHFSDEEKAAMMKSMDPYFEVVHHEKFYSADAILMKKRTGFRSPANWHNAAMPHE